MGWTKTLRSCLSHEDLIVEMPLAAIDGVERGNRDRQLHHALHRKAAGCRSTQVSVTPSPAQTPTRPSKPPTISTSSWCQRALARHRGRHRLPLLRREVKRDAGRVKRGKRSKRQETAKRVGGHRQHLLDATFGRAIGRAMVGHRVPDHDDDETTDQREGEPVDPGTDQLGRVLRESCPAGDDVPAWRGTRRRNQAA